MTTITSRVPARAHAPDRSGAPDPGGRRPARGGVRRALPGGRAVAGGLLVAVAAVGAFAVASGDDRPSTTYLVAAAAVPAGAPLDGAVTPAAIALLVELVPSSMQVRRSWQPPSEQTRTR